MTFKHRSLSLALAASLWAFAPSAQAATVSFQQLSPNATSYVLGTDFNLFYEVVGKLTPQINGVATGFIGGVGGHGCSGVDFGGFTAGAVALIERGACTFQIKAENAIAAGAIAMLVYDNLPATTVAGGAISSLSAQLPAFRISQAIGLGLLSSTAGPASVKLVIDTTPSNVPLPAGLPLLATGALALVARRKSRKAPA